MKLFRKKHKDNRYNRDRIARPSRSSTNVFSYRASRNNVEAGSQRNISRESLQKQNASIRMNKFIFLFISTVFLICILYIMTLENKAKVTTLSATASQQLLLRNTEAYQTGAEKILSNSIFNRFKLTINTNSLEETMKLNYPELDDVKIIVPIMGHRPVFQINASNPAFIISNNQGSFIANNKGRVMMRTEDIKNLSSLNLQTVIDQSGLKIETGKNILPDNDAKFISTIIEQLKAKKIDIQSITLPTIPNELDVRIVGKTYVVKFNLSDDSIQQIGAFLAVKEKLESEGKTPSEYIDLRVEERVYYK